MSDDQVDESLSCERLHATRSCNASVCGNVFATKCGHRTPWFRLTAPANHSVKTSLQHINTGVYISKPHPDFLYLTLRASALPTLSARQNPCNALGAGSTDSLSYNFTIAAIDMDAPDNSTGAPLALTTGPPGTSGEASTWWISTISASYQSDFPTFSLVGGALIPNPGPHEQGLAVYDNAVNPGSELEFTVTLPSSGLSNDATYCAVSDANGYATIAVNERTDKFALCEATGSAYIVVYEPSTTNDGLYQADTCAPKRLRAVRV